MSEIKRFLQSLGVKVSYEAPEKTQAFCPLAPYTHSKGKDNKPSFVVFHAKGKKPICYCSSCHFKGSISWLLKTLSAHDKKDRSDQLEAVETFEILGLTAEEEAEESPAECALDYVFEKATLDEIEIGDDYFMYMKSRLKEDNDDLVLQTIKRWGIMADTESKRVCVPVIDPDGVFYGWVKRIIDDSLVSLYNPKVDNTKGMKKANHLLGVHTWSDSKEIVLVEGPFDAIYIDHVTKQRYNVAACMGSAVSDVQIYLLSLNESDVVLLLDNDQAGEHGTFGKEGRNDGALHKLLAFTNVRLPSYPEGAKDPADLSKKELHNMLVKTPFVV